MYKLSDTVTSVLCFQFSFYSIMVQVLLDGAYRPTDFKCEITLFLDIKKDRATGSPLLGLLICYEIAQKEAKMPLKMQK